MIIFGGFSVAVLRAMPTRRFSRTSSSSASSASVASRAPMRRGRVAGRCPGGSPGRAASSGRRGWRGCGRAARSRPRSRVGETLADGGVQDRGPLRWWTRGDLFPRPGGPVARIKPAPVPPLEDGMRGDQGAVLKDARLAGMVLHFDEAHAEERPRLVPLPAIAYNGPPIPA